MIGLRNVRRLGAGLALLAVLGLAGGGAEAQVVISQSYGGGGNSGATYTHDFIELFNRGHAPVDLSGWSVQYASASGSSWQVTPLGSTTLQPGQYYLVQQAQGSGGSTALPTPDVMGGISMSGSSGKVALVAGTSELSGACPASSLIQDMIGIGSSATCYEGNGPAPGISSTTAAMRADAGCNDTNSNDADFTAQAPVPRNSEATLNVCSGGPTAPVVSFDTSTITVAEGDAAAHVFTFIVHFAPAIASGQTLGFDIAVSGDAGRFSYTGPSSIVLDDTAVSPFLINVETVPNTVIDGNTSVSISLSNFSGADASQSDPVQMSATIVDDDIPFTAISAIQGTGAVSPLVGQSVTTRGIVTGITDDGRSYYLQSQAVDEDSDPASSEGLYVYGTSATPAATGLALGDLVYVSGTVTEYSPASGGLPITELSWTTTTVLSSANSLPAPIVLSGADTDPNGAIDALERYEYMRVTIPRFVVSAPTGSGASDEQFGVIEGVSRPFREAGVDLFRCGVNPAIPGTTALPVEAPANVSCFDHNPELLRIKSKLLAGGAVLPVMRTGAVLQDLTGVLDYASGRYTVLTRVAEPFTLDASTQAAGTPVSVPSRTDVTIGGYNVENLAYAGGVTYTRKADKIAQTIVNYLQTPDVLGLIEVADLATLQDIATRVSSIAANDPLYEAVLVGSSGTQRLGFLVKKAFVGATPRVSIDGTPVEHGAGLHVLCPDGVSYTTGLLNDRPPLQMDVQIEGPNGLSWPLTIINNHLKSMIDLDSTADADANYACFNNDGGGTYMPGGEGRRNRAKRQQNAEFLAELVQQLQTDNPARAIVMVGDFNAYEFSDGYADLMGTIKGEPAANDETVVPDDGADLVDPDLVLLTELVPHAQRYSYSHEGNAQTIDQVLVNEAVLSATVGEPRMEFGRVNADFTPADASDASNAFANSDHDPALVFLDIAAFRNADLELTLTPVPLNASVGDTLTFVFTLDNHGPDDAVDARFELTLPTGVLFTSLNAPPGWMCSTPAVGGSGAIICTVVAPMGSSASASFNVMVTLGSQAGGTTVTAPIYATTRSNDPILPNQGSFVTHVDAQLEFIFSDGFEP
ncbi:MAG TPA: lamin tail domain-containing protein [Chiayiivirga sp.]|nr:lamin tail domain-containing protein [Chiayiivirga sp.]